MKTRSLPILLVLLLASCGTIAPGQDAVIVQAQRTLVAAHTTFDLLFQLERQNEAYTVKYAPAVHKGVNALRSKPGQKGPVEEAEDLAWAAVRVYAEYKSPQNKANLDTALAAVETLLTQATSYMAQIPGGKK